MAKPYLLKHPFQNPTILANSKAYKLDYMVFLRWPNKQIPIKESSGISDYR